MKEYLKGDYQAAEAGFRFFLALYPDSSLATHAQYWLGECEFRLGRYEEAITAFDATLADRPLIPALAAAALMKKGMSYAAQGDTARSRHLLELVVVQFPESHEATVARRDLMLAAP